MKTILYLLCLPIIVLWRILRSVAPEITRPLDVLANSLGEIFRPR